LNIHSSFSLFFLLTGAVKLISSDHKNRGVCPAKQKAVASASSYLTARNKKEEEKETRSHEEEEEYTP
jgi:hypothetical protein